MNNGRYCLGFPFSLYIYIINVIINLIKIQTELRTFLADTDNEERLNRQRITISEGVAQAKDTLTNLAKEHRDLHGFVSKVGKSIDRNFTSDFTSTARTDALANEENVQLLNKVIAQHFYRQGMDDVADTLIKVSNFHFISRNS